MRRVLLLMSAVLVVCCQDPSAKKQKFLERIWRRDQIAKQLAETQFEIFLEKYDKPYANDINERQKRFNIFRDNLKRIRLLNANERGTARYGVTQFADLTTEEFRRFTGLRPSLATTNDAFQKPFSSFELSQELPSGFDWREREGVVSGVKNQGMCGSCWAFSTTGNVEGVWAIKKNQSVSLSEQELVDCDKVDEGCGGGLPTNAFQTIIKLGGLETESEYPYTARNQQCSFHKKEVVAKIDSYVVLPENETQLAQWLVKHGPISIGINANAMQFYFGGISHPWKFACSPKELDHGVLIVGFGVGKTRILHKTLPFWVIKNSWGTSWGEKGYYRVYRGDGTCGLNKMASSAYVN